MKYSLRLSHRLIKQPLHSSSQETFHHWQAAHGMLRWKRAAAVASKAAECEAEGAARDATKHVYILAGYAEPAKPCSSGLKAGTSSLRSSQSAGIAAAVCKATALEGSAATASGNKTEDQQASNTGYSFISTCLPAILVNVLCQRNYICLHDGSLLKAFVP